MKKGIERAPHRSLMKAMGYTNEEISRPLIGIAHAHNQIIPGHIHLDKILEAVKTGVKMACGRPIPFGTIGVFAVLSLNPTIIQYPLSRR